MKRQCLNHLTNGACSRVPYLSQVPHPKHLLLNTTSNKFRRPDLNWHHHSEKWYAIFNNDLRRNRTSVLNAHPSSAIKSKWRDKSLLFRRQIRLHRATGVLLIRAIPTSRVDKYVQMFAVVTAQLNLSTAKT